MSINFGYAYKRFNEEQERNKRQYQRLGMSKIQIEEILEFDKKQFLENTRYLRHTQPFSTNAELNSEEGNCPLIKKFNDSFTTKIDEEQFTRFWWIEELENECLLKVIRKMSDEEIELLTLVVVEGYSQHFVAQLWGLSDNAISYRMKKITRTLKEHLLEIGGAQ